MCDPKPLYILYQTISDFQKSTFIPYCSFHSNAILSILFHSSLYSALVPCFDIFNPQLLSLNTLGKSGYLYNNTPLVVMSSFSKLGLSHFLRVSSTISQIRLLSKGSPPSISIVAGAILCDQSLYHCLISSYSTGMLCP